MHLFWGLFDPGYDVGFTISSPKNMSMNGWHSLHHAGFTCHHVHQDIPS